MTKLSPEHLRILEQAEISCFDFVNCQGDYQDKELPASLRLRMDEHMATCNCCRKFEAEYRQVIEIAASLKPQIPSEVQSRLRKSLNEKLGLNLAC